MHQIGPFRVSSLSLSYLDVDEQKLFILQCFALAFFILYYIYVAVCLWKSGLQFFTYPWNLCDLIIIILSINHMAEQSNVYSTFMSEPTFQPDTLGRPDMFAPFSKLIDPIRSRNNTLAFVCLFCWLRCVKYFTLLQSFRLLVRVLEKTMWDLFVFGSLLLIIFAGFSVAFYSGFGHLAPFSSLQASFYSLFFILSKSADISGLFESSWLGEALFVAYLILVYFLLFNMFMAIVIDTFSLATLLSRNVAQGDSPVGCFFVAYFNKLRGTHLVGAESEEDIGSPDEQFIQTSLLPKAISVAWEAKHEEMVKLVQEEGYKVEMRKDVVSRVQLQRMMDEDEDIVALLGTKRAIDVVRKFRIPDLGKNSHEEVAKLQENVFRKIEELEADNSKLEFEDVERLRMVSAGLHDALTELQRHWRKELTCVLEVISSLSENIQQLCTRLDRVQMNHLVICQSVETVAAKPAIGL